MVKPRFLFFGEEKWCGVFVPEDISVKLAVYESESSVWTQASVSMAGDRGSTLAEVGKQEDHHGTEAEAAAAAAWFGLALEADRLLVHHTSWDEETGSTGRRARRTDPR